MSNASPQGQYSKKKLKSMRPEALQHPTRYCNALQRRMCVLDVFMFELGRWIKSFNVKKSEHTLRYLY